jgi:hypothetical protein
MRLRTLPRTTPSPSRGHRERLEPGNGRTNRCARDELSPRLDADGITYDAHELDEVLIRLEDVGRVVRVHPQLLVLSGDHHFDSTDVLAADVCAVIKRRGDRFESDEELVQWLETDRVPFTPGSLSTALHQLTSIGRIKRNVADQWNSEQPLPGMYVEPRIRSA